MRTGTSLVAGLAAAALCLPVAAPAVAASSFGSATFAAQVPSASAPSARSGSIGGASSAKLGKSTHNKTVVSKSFKIFQSDSKKHAKYIAKARPIGKSEAAYDASKKAEQKVFAKGAADPQEQQADCMATAITGSTRYNYYTSSCKGSRAKNAKPMWKKWGLKYQNPERSWTTPAS